jgi:hypothetical protein
MEVRYGDAVHHVSRFLPIQLGVSLFEIDGSEYISSTYNFNLFPRQEAGDNAFMVQASGFEFLRKNKFDFNKWIDGGVPVNRFNIIIFSFLKKNIVFRLVGFGRTRRSRCGLRWLLGRLLSRILSMLPILGTRLLLLR